MKPTLIILFLVSAFLVNSCDRETKHASITPAKKNQLNFAGDWEHNFPFYSSSLILESSGKFRFMERNCFGQRYSEGLWTSGGAFVTLNSFDKFKETPHSATEPIAELSDSSFVEFVGDSVVWKPQHLNVSYRVPPLPDTTYEYFNSQRFVFQQDTLYELEKNVVLTGRKFSKRRILIEARL
jgi:hypothetical protein